MTRRVQIGCLLLMLAAFVCGGARDSRAQEEGAATTYLTPFPPGDTYRVLVIGDFLAEGMHGALIEGLGTGDARVQVQRKVRSVAGLLKVEVEQELSSLEGELQRERTNIAVVMLGHGDRMNHRTAQGRRLSFASEEWKDEYGRRVDLLMKGLKRRNVAVYWAGMPPLRRSEANDDARMINDIVRERAYLNGIRYIDIFVAFADEDGDFTTVGPDITGKSRALRASDGVGFTAAGNQKLAWFVEEEIKRDINLAKAARGVPLAGSEAEQKRIQASLAKAAAPKGVAWQTTTAMAAAPQAKAAGGAADAVAESGRITLKAAGAGGREETLTLDILRPAVPATVIALITRREALDRGGQPFGDGQVRVVGGLAVIESVAGSPDASGPQGKRRAVSVQSPFFRAIIKGERLPPRPGRADDFSWPRPEPAAEPAQPPQAGAPQPPAPGPALKSAPVKGRPSR